MTLLSQLVETCQLAGVRESVELTQGLNQRPNTPMEQNTQIGLFTSFGARKVPFKASYDSPQDLSSFLTKL